jgi:hypothetical protein
MVDDAENLDSDGVLDRTIHDAMRVKVDEQRLAKLSQFWRVESQSEQWRRTTRRTAASVAAAIALVAASLLIRNRDTGQREQVSVPPSSANEVVESRPPKPAPAEATKPVDPLEPAGRAPTAYEQVVFTARTGIAPRQKPAALPIDDIIQRIATDAAVDPAQILDSSGIKRPAAETLLLRRLPRAPAAEHPAILRLFAVCGSQRSVPWLLRFARDESLRAESLSTLEQIVGLDGMAQAAHRATDRSVRSALFLHLLAADSRSGLLSYLSLVGNEATRSEALSVAKSAPHATIERLLALLDDPDESVRVAAAIVLANINGSETTRLLIARVTEQPGNSCEAWLALMECRGEMAREFLDYATNRPQLLGYYNNARVRRAQMTP